MRKLLLSLGGVAAVTLFVPTHALATPYLVVWSGARAPHGTARGVVLRADGSGRRYATDTDGRTRGTGTFAPRGASLTAIRAAAEDVLRHAPSTTVNDALVAGGYTLVAVKDGTRGKLVFDRNADPASVRTLLRRLDAALPGDARLPEALARSARPLPTAHAALSLPLTSPSVAKCQPGASPIHVTKVISLPNAVATQLVLRLTAKGPVSGDAVALDGKFRSDVPNAALEYIEVTVDNEVTSSVPGRSAEGAAYALNALAQLASNDYEIGGASVRITPRFTARPAGAGPTPCFNQIELTNGDRWTASPTSRDLRNQQIIPGAAAIGAGGADLGSELEYIVGRAELGFPDRSSDFLSTPLGELPLPGSFTGEALDQLLHMAEVSPLSAQVHSEPDPKSDPHDVMATGTGRYTADDVRALLAANSYQYRVLAKPGQLLGNKHVGGQNLGVGAPGSVTIGPGETVHVDGIVAYCLDLLDHASPQSGVDTFDVLPQVGDYGGAAMQALQRVLEVVAAREPGPLEETPGASAAIWRVTDGLDPQGDDAAVSILQAAGVPVDPADTAYDTPHLVDPAAAAPGPVALASFTDPAPLPVPAPTATPRAPAPPRAKLAHLRLRRRRYVQPPRGRTALIVARVTMAGAPDEVTLSLTRRRKGHSVTIARTQPARLAPGVTSLLLSPRLAPGAYELAARGRHSGTLRARIVVAHRRR
jgi:hypothetical protein